MSEKLPDYVEMALYDACDAYAKDISTTELGDAKAAILRYAAEVRAAAVEECAKVCEEFMDSWKRDDQSRKERGGIVSGSEAEVCASLSARFRALAAKDETKEGT